MHKRAGACHALLAISVLAALVIAAGCTTVPPPASSAQFPEDSFAGAAWKDTPLTDLQGRGNITVSGFAGKIVLVPVLSVSCPPCIVQLTRQLGEIDRLARDNPGIAVVSLDIDPNTGPSFVETWGDPDHASGYAARSPQDLTLQIYHRFGPFVIDPSTIPVILVCPNGQDFLLPTGLKTAGALNETIAREC
jgi:hypothetical protein